MTSSQNGFHGYQWVHMRSSFVIVTVALYFWAFNGSFTWCDFSECDCIFTAHKRSLRRLCFYRCLSVHRWACVVGACMAGGRVWQGACMTGEGRCVVGGHAGDTMRYGQWAGGTYPTGMHSSLYRMEWLVRMSMILFRQCDCDLQ